MDIVKPELKQRRRRKRWLQAGAAAIVVVIAAVAVLGFAPALFRAEQEG